MTLCETGIFAPPQPWKGLDSVLIVKQFYLLWIEIPRDSVNSDGRQGGLVNFNCVRAYSDNNCGQELQTIKLCTDESY